MKRLVSILLVMLMVFGVVGAQAASATPEQVEEMWIGCDAGYIYVGWSDVANATNYEVYRSQNGGSWKKVATLKKNEYDYLPTWYNDKNVKVGVKYSYKVRALNGSKKGEFSGSDSTYYVDYIRITNITMDGGKITLKWQKPNKATSIAIHYRADDEENSKYVELKGTDTSYTITNCKSGEVYHISIQCEMKAGEHDYYWGNYHSISVVAK